MRKSIFSLCLIASITILSCSKSDDNSGTTPTTEAPKEDNFYIGLRNNTDADGSCKTRQLVKLELSLSSGTTSMEKKFTLNAGDIKTYGFYIPDTDSYDIKVYTNDGQYVKWKHVSLSPNYFNQANIIQVGAKNGDYLKGCMFVSIGAAESTVDCN